MIQSKINKFVNVKAWDNNIKNNIVIPDKLSQADAGRSAIRNPVMLVSYGCRFLPA